MHTTARGGKEVWVTTAAIVQGLRRGVGAGAGGRGGGYTVHKWKNCRISHFWHFLHFLWERFLRATGAAW